MLVCVCVCACVCPLEAVDLSSTQRRPAARVLPPPRPTLASVPRLTTSSPSAVLPSSLLPSHHQPTLYPSLAVVQRSKLILTQQPALKPSVLPSVLDQQPTLKATVPPVIAQSVPPVVPLSAATADPQLSQDPQLDVAGQRVSGNAESVPVSETAEVEQMTSVETFVADKLCSEQTARAKQVELPTAVSSSVADEPMMVQTSGSQQTSLPDDLSTKQSLLGDEQKTQRQQTFGADDQTTEQSTQQISREDNLSVKSTSKPAAFEVVSKPDRSEEMPTEMRIESTFVPDSVSGQQSGSSTTEVKKQETLLVDKLPSESLALGDCVSATQKHVVATTVTDINCIPSK